MIRSSPFYVGARVVFSKRIRVRGFCASLAGMLLGLLSISVSAQISIETRGDAVSIRALGIDTAASFLVQEKVRIQLAELSTISAIEAVAKGQAEMALAARDKHPGNALEETLQFDPIAWEAIVAITHPGNPVQDISLRQLRDIYAGKLTSWDQLGGRAEPIHLAAVAGPMDGVEYAMRKALFGRGHIPVAAQRWYLNTAQLEAAIAIDRSGLGISALSNVLNNPKIKRLSLEGVPATRSNVKQGEYLLVTPIYVVHRAQGTLSPVGRYLRFLRTDRPSRLAMQRKKLLPIRAADLLNEIFETRAQKILAMLQDPPPLAPLPAATRAITTPLNAVPVASDVKPIEQAP